MANDMDDEFFARADAHIHLSNDQINPIGRGKVSASMMYATARFNAWVSARGFSSAGDMAQARDATIDYHLKQYRAMLEENFDDYTKHFARYMDIKK